MQPEAHQRGVDALIERCYSGLDAVGLRRDVAARLRTMAGVDAAFAATVAPVTLLFTSAISEEPLLESAPAFLANELGGHDVNRFSELAVGQAPVRTLDQATDGDRDRSARHAAIMRPLGLGDELRVALRTRQACWGVIQPRPTSSLRAASHRGHGQLQPARRAGTGTG